MKSGTTLSLTRPFGRTLLGGVGLFLALLLLIEVGVRLLISSGALPMPYFTSQNPQWNIKLMAADLLAERVGGIDCIFFGSSQINNGIDPQAFATAYQEKTGEEIVCFNFSLATLSGRPAGALGAILIERYHPGLFILGTSARDFSAEYGGLTRPLVDDPWVRYKNGDFNLRGMLLDHSLAFRSLVSYQQMSDPEYRKYFDQNLEMNEYGYTVIEGGEIGVQEGIVIPGYEISQEDLAGLENILRLWGQTQVIILEAPVYHTFLSLYLGETSQAYEELFIEPFRNFIETRGVLFLRSIPAVDDVVPDEGWYDLKHFNTVGARLFSAWLVDQILMEVESGEIDAPFE